jgi:hypothetical protein
MRRFHILSAEWTNGVVVPTSPLESITGPYTVLENEACVELALGVGGGKLSRWKLVQASEGTL